MRFLRFDPIYQERVWGGSIFAPQLQRQLASTHFPFGESWEISDRPEAESRIATGEHQGRTLHELIVKKTAWLMGTGWHPRRRFPILVKWLDCRERLSLQVHPPQAIADTLGGEPKNEVWYVAHAEPQASLFSGLKPGTTVEQFRDALTNNQLEPHLQHIPVKKGHAVYIPSGCLHAIDAGCLILEIQQNSDTTYRVYDWGRPRQLHLSEALQCINFNEPPPTVLTHESRELCIANCAEFRVRAFLLQPGEPLPPAKPGKPALIGVVEGQLREQDGSPVKLGDNILLPAGETFHFTATVPTRVLFTDNFA